MKNSLIKFELKHFIIVVIVLVKFSIRFSKKIIFEKRNALHDRRQSVTLSSLWNCHLSIGSRIFSSIRVRLKLNMDILIISSLLVSIGVSSWASSWNLNFLMVKHQIVHHQTEVSTKRKNPATLFHSHFSYECGKNSFEQILLTAHKITVSCKFSFDLQCQSNF